MSTPHGHARLMLARRTAFDLLDTWGVPDADERATQLIDALQAAGWGPPREITHTPARGSHSTEAARAAAREHLAAVLAGRRAPTTSTTGSRTVAQRGTVDDTPPSPGAHP